MNKVRDMKKNDKKREEDAYDIFRKIWNSRLKGQKDEQSTNNGDSKQRRSERTD